MIKESYKVIGLMSGSSLDGVDLVGVNFNKESDQWRYTFFATRFIPYPNKWKSKLKQAFHLSKTALEKLDKAYGSYLGVLVKDFVQEFQLEPDFISSHGHTIFHRPEAAFTLQIGSGQAMADASGLMVINDFRSEDVAKGGQGAPLVPIGDQLLFSDYDCCLNIGGIANLSAERKRKRIAYDICIANQALNYIAGFKGLDMDIDGALAKKGELIPSLFEKLEKHVYYKQNPPKSLGREFFETHQKPLIQSSADEVENIAFTFSQHIVSQISNELNTLNVHKVLVSGGGSFNSFLISHLKRNTSAQIILADETLINFKEALIFAFLGVLKFRGEVNVLASVTGANSDSCSGAIWHPN